MPTYRYKREELTTQKEVQKMLEDSNRFWFKSLLAFLYVFGCRITEALTLKRKHLWVKDGQLYAQIGVLKKRTKGPYIHVPHILHVNLNSPFVKKYLVPYLEAARGKNGVLWNKSRVAVWMHMKELNEKTSPHLFRHDRLMKIALKGASDSELRDWAGWTDTRPAQNYIQTTGRLASKFSDQIE